MLASLQSDQVKIGINSLQSLILDYCSIARNIALS